MQLGKQSIQNVMRRNGRVAKGRMAICDFSGINRFNPTY